jgi:hypothetical protein
MSLRSRLDRLERARRGACGAGVCTVGALRVYDPGQAPAPQPPDDLPQGPVCGVGAPVLIEELVVVGGPGRGTSMNLRARVRRLEQALGAGRYPRCKDRPGEVRLKIDEVVVATRAEPEAVAAVPEAARREFEEALAPCLCGWEPEVIHEVPQRLTAAAYLAEVEAVLTSNTQP